MKFCLLSFKHVEDPNTDKKKFLQLATNVQSDKAFYLTPRNMLLM